MQQTTSTKTHGAEQPIAHEVKAMKVGNTTLGVVFGETSYIVSINECIHGIYPNSETADVPYYDDGCKTKDMTLDEIRALATEPLDIAGWVHYWGIKSRMAYNYALLKRSMKEIGVSTKGMPEWPKYR